MQQSINSSTYSFEEAADNDPVVYSLALYAVEMEEIRISPIISKKGFVNILEERKGGWFRKYLVRIVFERFTALVSIEVVQ
jgi:kinesin family protein 1